VRPALRAHGMRAVLTDPGHFTAGPAMR